MREIKFRAFDLKDNLSHKMRYFDLTNISHSQSDRISAGNDVVMQYTGLKDKNGKEIYEGDIISNMTTLSPNGKEEKKHIAGAVEWDGFYWKPFNAVIPMRCEIIGNIYENSDLLK